MRRKPEEPPPLTDAERAAGFRWMRLGKGPWRKLEPGAKTAKDYLQEHHARVAVRKQQGQE